MDFLKSWGWLTMTQIISRDGIVLCVTSIPYPAWIIKDMKQAGYKVKNKD